MLSVRSVNFKNISSLNSANFQSGISFRGNETDTFVSSSVVFSDNIKEKFTPKQLENLSKKSPEFIQKVQNLSLTKLSGDNILSSVKYAHFDFDAKKLADKILDMQNICGDKLDSIALNNNRYDENAIDIIAKNKDGSRKTAILDKNLNVCAVQDVSFASIDNKKIEIKKEKDFKNGITSEVRSHVVSEDTLPIPLKEIIITDKYKEFSEPSEIKGVFNTKRIYNDGREEQISSGVIDKKSGIKIIKKDMLSFDGTRTLYEYSDDPLGNRIVDYKILDKSGKTLYKNSEAFEVIDENTFISSKNDKSYTIKYSDNDNKLNIFDNQTKDNVEIDLHMFIFGSKDKLIPALKKVSGDELIKMSKNVNRLFQQDDSLTSCYKPGEKDVTTCSNDYILIHELGHAKDMKDYDTSTFKTKDATEKLLISANKDVLDIYLNEKNLFNTNFSTNQRENIDYFINGTGRYTASRSVKETIAEINAIINACNNVEKYSLRSEYLQRYFPRTISKLAEIL